MSIYFFIKNDQTYCKTCFLKGEKDQERDKEREKEKNREEKCLP